MRFGGIWDRAVVAVTALLIVGACSGPEPKEPEPTSSSATPSSTAPTMPEQAEENTPEGAAAFVKHYIDVFNYASNTGDVEELSRLSSPECEGCQSYIDLYEKTYKAGGYFRGKAWSLSNSRTSKEGASWLILSHAKSAPGTFRQSTDDQVSSGQRVNSEIGFRVSHRASDWSVDEFGLGEAAS